MHHIHHARRRPVHRTPATGRDRGNILPMVLVCAVVLSLIVAGLANYLTTGLRYGQVVEDRADRLAAADGGMRYAVERLSEGAAQICAAAGTDTIDPPDMNGAVVTVSCGQIGDGFDDTNGWALILTGEDYADGSPLLRSQSGVAVAKLVGGPVYMNSLDFDTQAPIEFRYAQLLYTDANCEGTPTIPANVSFDSTSLGLACTERPWNADASSNGMFSEPNNAVGTVPPVVDPAPVVDGNGCTVWSPGIYTNPAMSSLLGSHNYFRSGNYLMDGVTLEIKQAKVTAGRRAAGDTSGATQFIPNTVCDTARDSDVGGITTAGVTFYLRNGANFVIDSQGTFEVLRRKQGRNYVSIHVLDSSLSGTQDVILQGPGTNKDMAIHGLVWAPEARITFSEVTNTANGQLLGGAVLSNVDLRSSASADEFVIAVEPSDLHGKLRLESTATTKGGSTTIRSIVDYRPTTRYTAVTSWRVTE
jgi:hypothetical protein